MVRLNVNLSQEHYDFLKNLDGISISAWIRMVINEAIQKEKLHNVSASASVKEK